MATQPQGRHFSSEQLASIRERIQAERAAEADSAARRQRNLQGALTQQELTRDRTWGEAGADTGLALLQGAVDLGSAAYGIGNLATFGGLENLTGMSDNFAETDEILEGGKSNQLRYQKMMAGEAFDDSLISGAAAYVSNPGLLSDLLVRSAPSILPGAGFGATAARTAAAGATARGATAAQAGQQASRSAARAATGSTAAQTGGMAYTEAYNQAINEGLSPEEARTRAYGAAAIVGPATAATMAVPGLGPAGVEGQVLARMFGGEAGRTVGAGMGVARGFVDATGREAVQETLQGTSEQFAQNLMSTERNVGDNLGQAAVLSAIAGGAMGAGLGVMRAPSELRNNLDRLRIEAAEETGDVNLGLSETEQNDARVQGSPLPGYLRSFQPSQGVSGRDLLTPNQDIVADATPLPDTFEQPPLADVSEDVDLGDTPLPAGDLPEVADATPEEIAAAREASLPRVREIESERLTDAEEAIQIMELFNPTVRQDIESGAATEDSVVRDVQFMRDRGMLPPRPETESGRQLFESVTTPSTGITEADLYAPPTATPASKAFKAYQRRVAQRGSVEVNPGEDLLGDNVAFLERANARRAARVAEGDAPAQPVDERTGDLFAQTPNAVRSVRTPVNEVIDRAVGVGRGSNISQSDILSGEDAYIADQFGEPVRTDAQGDPVYAQYDRDLQTMVEVSQEQARNEAQEFVRQRTGEPSELFKGAMAQEFDLSENTALRGKGWKAFAEAVDNAGVRPTDTNVASELVTIAQNLDGTGLPASKFYSAFMNKYGPGSDIARSFEPAPKKTKKKAPEPETGSTFSGKDWKQALSKRLGLKPSQMRGKAWQTFDAMVKERNIGPADESAEAFLQDVSAAIDAPPESAPAFAATLRTAYPVEQEVTVEPETEENTSEAEAAPEAEATQAVEGLSRDADVQANDMASMGNVRLRTEFFMGRFAEEADGIRSQYRSDAKAKPEIGALLGKMVNEISRPEDIPALAHAMASHLEFRSYTPKQRVGAFYTPLAEVTKRFMAEAETPQRLREILQISDQVFSDTSTLADRSDTMDSRGPMMDLESDIANYYAERVDMLVDDPANPNNTMKFSRTGDGAKAQGDPISQTKFDQAIERANRVAQPGERQIVGYNTVAEAEAALGIPMPRDANGVYYNGEAAVIRENITNTDQLADTMLHERAHGGLEGLLGADRLRAVQNRLWANNSLRGRIKTKMESHQLSRQEAAEEVLVDMIVGREKINKSIFSKIRAAINRTAEILAGVGSYSMTDGQVESLLQDTADYMRGGRTYHEGPLGGYMNGLAEYEAVARGDIAPMSPKFSTAGIDLESATKTGEVGLNAMKKASTSLGDAVRTAMSEKTFKPMTDLMPPSATRMSSWMMDFTPVRAIARHYSGLLDAVKTDADGNETRVDTLRNHASLVRQKDNDFNKSLHERREFKYRGPDGKEESMTFSNQEVAEQWATFRRKNPDNARTLDQLNNRATTYKLHPDRTWDQQSKLNYERLPYTEQERRSQFDKLKSEWDSMGDQARTLYKQAQASYHQTWTDRFRELESTIMRESGLERTKLDPETGQVVRNAEWAKKWRQIIDTSVAKLSDGPYSPLQRHGDFFLTVRDADGGVLSFMGFDSEREAMIARRNLIESRTDESIQVQFSVRKNFDRAMDGMNRKVFENMENALEATFPPDANGVSPGSQAAAKEALRSVYLSSLEDSHILKHGVKRKLTDGASLDTLRGFTSYTLKSARSLSSMRYDHQIEDNLRDMERAIDPNGSPQKVSSQNAVYNAVRRQHRAAIEYDQNRISDIVTQTGFVYWMTSPSQMALNASQTALVTIPRLAAKYNMPGAMKAIGQATAKFSGTRFKGMHDPDATTLDKSGPHYQVMRELFDRGVLDFTLSHDMSGLARGDSFGMSSKKRTALRWMSTFMHSSEVANREVAAYASVEMELQSNPQLAQDLKSDNEQVRRKALDRLTDMAEDMVDTTQFDYSQSNKPTNLQGPVARVVFQFQQFRINMLAMMATDIKRAFQDANTPEQKAEKREAMRALAYMTGVQLMMTGAAGSVIAPVAFAILGVFQDDDELLSPREQFIQSVPQWMSQGFLSFGLDTARFGFDTLVPFIGGTRYMPVEDSSEDTFHWLLTNSLGAWVGLTDSFIRGGESLVAGDYGDAASKFAPKLFSDSIGGLMNWNQPTMTRDDVPYYTPSPYERLINGLGLKSGGQAEAQYNRSAVYNGMQRARNRKSSLLGQYHLASTGAEQREVMDQITRFNQTNPEIPITRETIKGSTMSRQRKIQNAAQMGVPLSADDPVLARRLMGD